MRVSNFLARSTFAFPRCFSPFVQPHRFIHDSGDETIKHRKRTVSVFGSAHLTETPEYVEATDDDSEFDYDNHIPEDEDLEGLPSDESEDISFVLNKKTDNFTETQLLEDQSDEDITYTPNSIELETVRSLFFSNRPVHTNKPPISDRIHQKKSTPKHLQNSFVGKETMFWIEIMQRGRSAASRAGIDPREASREMINGLSFAEWLGFADKYFSETPELRKFTYPENLPEKFPLYNPPSLHQDARFKNPTGRAIPDDLPDFKQQITNSEFTRLLKIGRDPIEIHNSLQNLLQARGQSVEPSPPSYANRYRLKPSGAQEEYVAYLLNRTGSKELQIVNDKKLYEPAVVEESFDKALEDDACEMIEQIIDYEEDYHIAPTYNVPEAYRVPSLIDEVNEALGSDSDVDTSPASSKEAAKEDEALLNRPNPRKTCRVCNGMKLEPMNGPFLMQLVDDCGLVLPRRQTLLCAKHQRKVAPTMARSIAMGVFSWKEGPLRYLDPFSPAVDDEEITIPKAIENQA